MNEHSSDYKNTQDFAFSVYSLRAFLFISGFPHILPISTSFYAPKLYEKNRNLNIARSFLQCSFTVAFIFYPY